jgi:hypothetical protein
MPIGHTVIDNFLDKDYFNHLKNTIMENSFPWFFQATVAEHERDTDFYFTHLIYNEGKINSDFYKELEPLIDQLKVTSLLRIKANLYPNLNKEIVNLSHVDSPTSHKGAILYINTNNGYTILDNSIKIDSVENRILLFDPSVPHQSTHCTDEKCRININFNYF